MATLDLATWATILGTWLLVIGTLAFAYWQLRQAQRLHSATTILELRERYYSPRLRHARRELSGWLLKSDRGEEIENWEVGIFFELMGFLTRTRVLEKRMVWNAFGSWVTSYYTLIREPDDLVGRWRRESNDPMIFAEFEWLAKQMMKLDRRILPGAKIQRPAVEDARVVLDSEAHLNPAAEDGLRFP
jgi:hypothetical protein